MTEAFRRAALSWAAGGRGKPLVDAAANALAAEFYGYAVASQYADELDTWGVMDDYFVMLAEGVIYGSDADGMPSLIAELEELSRSTSGFEATPSESLGDEAWRGGYYELVLVLGEVSDRDAEVRLDAVLVSIARSIGARSRFLRGAIGHEVSELSIEDQPPRDRPFAYVSSSEAGVFFHPPTRWS